MARTRDRADVSTWALFALVLALVAVLLAPGVARAAAGGLDRSFSGNGKVKTDFGSQRSWANSMAIDAHGRIVAAGAVSQGGRTSFALARYRRNGHLDRSFSRDGRVRTTFARAGHAHPLAYASAVAIDSKGRIVAAGGPDKFTIARYKPNGRLDRSFGNGGKVQVGLTTQSGASALAIDSRDRIIAAGGGIIRLLPNGHLDRTFGDGGRVVSNDGVMAVALDSRRRIVTTFGENHFSVARFKPNGAPDPSFGVGGRAQANFPSRHPGLLPHVAPQALAIGSGNRVVLAGYVGRDAANYALARFKPNGNLDHGFSGDGKVVTRFRGDRPNPAKSVAIDAKGRIVAAGGTGVGEHQSGRLTLARYKANGHLDRSFGKHGKVRTRFGRWSQASSMAITARGRIVVAGQTDHVQPRTDGSYFVVPDFAVARYLG